MIFTGSCSQCITLSLSLPSQNGCSRQKMPRHSPGALRKAKHAAPCRSFLSRPVQPQKFFCSYHTFFEECILLPAFSFKRICCRIRVPSQKKRNKMLALVAKTGPAEQFQFRQTLFLLFLLIYCRLSAALCSSSPSFTFL